MLTVVGVEGKRHTSTAALEKLPRTHKVAPLAKSFIGNTLHVMGRLGWEPPS